MESTVQYVLVVDDDPDMRDVLETALGNFGYTPIVADDGDTALELFHKYNPKLVISDIYMPRVDGIRLLATIKSEKPETRVILITGYSYLDSEEKNLDINPDFLLRKPFALRELLKAIESF